MSFHLSEMLLVLVVALLVIKPENLPQVALQFAKALKSFRKMFTSLQRSLLMDSDDKSKKF